MSANREITGEGVRSLLKAVSVGAILGAGLLTPNAISLLEPFLGKVKNENKANEYKRLLKHMKRLDLITFDDKNRPVALTNKGKARLKKENMKNIVIPDQKTWDGRWRIVSFDIPVRMKSERYEFLAQLKRLGYVQAQRNMWIHPLESFLEVKEIAEALGIEKNLLLMRVDLTETQHEKLIKTFSTELKNVSLI